MPLLNHDEDNVSIVAPPGQPETPTLSTASVYQNKDVKCDITPNLSGNAWSVSYYNLIIGQDDAVGNVQDINDPSLQQYVKILGMQLKIDGELSQTNDPQTGQVTITGSANVSPAVQPQVGDAFIGEIDDGTLGIFTVTDARRLNHFKTAATAIEFTLIAVDDATIAQELETKKILTFYFNPNTGGLESEQQHVDNIQKEQVMEGLADLWYREFFNIHKRTILVSDGGALDDTYDPFVLGFWNRICPDVYRKDWSEVVEFDLRNTIFRQEFWTIWDVIADQDVMKLPQCVKQMHVIDTSIFGTSWVYRSLLASQIDSVIFPSTVGSVQLETGTDGDNYIFSDAFYNKDKPNQSELELLTWKIIDKTAITFTEIMDFVNTLQTISSKDRFYQIPILMAALIVI